MPFALLLAMQAAGMVTDWFGVHNQAKLSSMSGNIQQAGIESNIQQTRLETEDESLKAMIELRQNLGSQMAAYAARGTMISQGSSVISLEDSIGTANDNERKRRLNQVGKENTLRGGGLISSLDQQATNSKLWQGFSSRTINRFPSTTKGWGQLGKDSKSSFGLTSIGS